ncbi:uncharacterized protein LOC143178829 [Calliopsis andreniformis]|uniref:uncharacterized protein LOC143178829 n=1 Tax=Calliopsis andreniformis TaxID=337506 RepID=UPI003FCCC8B2
MGVGEATIRKIQGDGLSLKLDSNEQILEITGDGCTITVVKNCGRVSILGDGCRLRIDQNFGDVEYTGDGGQVLLGSKSIKNKVKYVGDGGKVTFDGDSKTNSKTRKFQVSKEKMSKNLPEGSTNASSKSKKHSGDFKETENALNAKKEAKFVRQQKQQTLTGTKVVTKFYFEDDLVSKWFINPGSVIKSFDGATFVKILPTENKTKIKVK